MRDDQSKTPRSLSNSNGKTGEFHVHWKNTNNRSHGLFAFTSSDDVPGMLMQIIC